MRGIALKRIASLRAGGTPSVGQPEYWSEDGLPWVAIGDMTVSPIVTRTQRCISDAGVRSARLEAGCPGTLLFAMYASLGEVAVLGIPAAWNQAILGIEPRQDLADARFVRYALVALRPTFSALARSNTQDNLNAEQVGNLQVPDIPLQRQRAIADFLDAETARIDALIASRMHMLSLAHERQLGTVRSGVSGRLTSQSDMRPTSLPWLSELPVNWHEVQLKLVARLGSGHTPSRSHPEWWMPDDCVIPWVTTGEVAALRNDDVELIATTREKLSEIGIANSSAELHPAGTVVLSRTASVGFSGILAEPMATSQDFATWRCGARLRPRFLLLCLRAMRPDLLGRLATGSTHKTIYMPDIESIRVPLPAVPEQDRVVDAVWSWLTGFMLLRDGVQSQIALLRERRQALITAAVTGEIDVTTASGRGVSA